MILNQNLSLFTPPTCLLVMAVSPWSPAAAEGPSPSKPTNTRTAANAIPATPVRGDAQCAISTNFTVRSEDPSHPADQTAAECERQRRQLQEQWLGRTDVRWTSRCEVTIHANEFAYLRHLGPRAVMTRGVSKIDHRPDRTISRHIDLMADPQSRKLSALAHELTHVVLADRFGTRQPPRWADEGIALLADDDEKKRLHLRDMRRALADECCPGVREALAMRRYPTGARLTAFYGQSLSLVSYLSELDEPARVVEMVSLAMDHGYDTALHEIYGIANTAELERRWRHHLSDQSRLVSHVR